MTVKPLCKRTLRWAIGNATAGDEINFTVAGTITLTSGQLTINKSLTITGPGEANLDISGGNTYRVFFVDNLGVCIVSMSGMTIRNGNTSGDGGGIYNEGGNVTMTSCTVSRNTANLSGGGICNDAGDLTLTSCNVSDNDADWDGGGIYNDAGNVTMTSCTVSINEARDGGGIAKYGGKLTMTSCWVSENIARDNGGGIYNNGYASEGLTMDNCTVSDNTAEGGQGGGIYNYSPLTMIDCTVSGNTADNDHGGGIYNSYCDDDATMTNCTVSGNSANGEVSYGGGIYSDDELTLTNCTISGNTAEDGGGIFNNDDLTLINCTISDNTAGGGESGGGIFNDDDLTMTCTIVYGNTAPTDPNFSGSYTDIGGESIVDEPLGFAPNPLLGPLQDNGGPTFTHALLTGSPAIDACIVSCNLTTDQRGQPRPIDGDLDGSAFCDVGAYEYQQQPVGGIVESVDRLSLMAPWLGLAAFISIALAVVVIMKRRRLA